MPRRDQRLDDIVECLYATTLEPEQWQPFLHLLRERFAATAAGISSKHERPITRLSQSWVGWAPQFERQYAEHYWRVDPWIGAALHRPVGEAIVGSQLFPEQKLEQSESCRDLGRHHGMHRVLGSVLQRDSEQIVWCSVVRDRGAGEFGPEEISLFKCLVPHLQRVSQIAQRLAAIHPMATVLRESNVPAVGVDTHGVVVWATPAAETILRQGDGLLSKAGVLHAELREEDVTLKNALNATHEAMPVADQPTTVTPARDASAPALGTFSIARPTSGRPAYVVQVRRCEHASHPLSGSTATRLVFILDPGAIPEVSQERIQCALGVTRAQARLLQVLSRGTRLRDAASQLAISYETARTQLKAMFDKLGVRRQSDLIRLAHNVATHTRGGCFSSTECQSMCAGKCPHVVRGVGSGAAS